MLSEETSSNVINRLNFDGKRLRKSLYRKTIDYNSSTLMYIQNRLINKFNGRRKLFIQPSELFSFKNQIPCQSLASAVTVLCTRFVKQATNKKRCPIYSVLWTPDGRRLTTGSASGEFTLWNGLVFNFETILQAHDEAILTMSWSGNDNWLISGDALGYLKYWQPNMNNVKMFQAHKEAVRDLSFCPTDLKFVSCSNDGTVRIWDFFSAQEERVYQEHGSDVLSADWHPTKGLIVSGSRDSQRPLKLWDPRTESSIQTLHVHKSGVTNVSWNVDGNRFLSASEDRSIKLFDVRYLSNPVQVFTGHKKEISVVAWHPVYRDFFASGGNDGSIFYWSVGTVKEIGSVLDAHDSTVWSLSWHPLGHLLVSGSNDHSIKFWTRFQPGDQSQLELNMQTAQRDDDDEPDVLTILSEAQNFRKKYEANIPGFGNLQNEDLPRKPIPIFSKPAQLSYSRFDCPPRGLPSRPRFSRGDAFDRQGGHCGQKRHQFNGHRGGSWGDDAWRRYADY